MLGDDASMVFMELIKRLLEIVRTVADGHNRNGVDKTKAPKTPKIKMGRLSKKDFNRLRNAGMNFNYVTVPKEKLEELEKTVKHLGGSMFATKLEEGNNAVIAVPSLNIDLVNTAIKHITADILKNDPNSLKIKDGTEKVDEADMKLTADVLRSHDIPVYSFKSSDGKYMNVVPDEFEGQYEAAMKEAKQLSQLMKNIEITRYEQTSPLDSLDVFAVKLSPEAAKALYAAAKYSNLDVQFAKYGDSVVAKYSPAIADKVEKAQQEFDEGLAESEKYIIDIKDNTITMNREKLLVEEDKASYFVRVPNTAGLDYLRLDKSDVTVSNDGKTLSMKLDMDKTYTVFDRDGHIKNERSAAELAKSYNTKSLRANKDTVIAKYGEGTLRIELYNKEQNRLISLGIDRADKLRTELLAEGLKARTVELLLNDIYSKLPDKYKVIFGYTEEKTEIVYADIPNIGEYLAQSQLSQQLIGRAECYGEIPKDNGSKFCFFDKSANKFTVLPVMPRAEVAAALTQMGYSEISAKEIADRIVSSYRDTDKEKGGFELTEDKKISPKFFESNNPELTGFMYHNSEYGMLIVQEVDDQYKYMDIDRGTPMAEVEKALLNNFDIKDEKSAAEIMKQLAADGIIEAPNPRTVNDITISKLSTGYIEISKGGESAVMPKNKLDREKLTSMGISEKDCASIEKALKSADRAEKISNNSTLRGLERIAKSTVAATKSAGGALLNAADKVKGKNQHGTGKVGGSMASNFGEQKKKGFDLEMGIFVGGATVIFFLCIWGGYVLEMTADKKGIDLMAALNGFSEYINPVYLIKAIGAVFTGNGITKKGMIFGIAGGALLILYKLSGTGKRYHRRGSEHGSARWGNKQEKAIIADNNDFYNNVIAASDVFLVLDRKKREENEGRPEKKKGSKKKEKNTVPEIIPETADTFENEKLTLKKVAEMKKEAAKIKPMLNLNMIILGGSGTGKSRFYVKPNIMQCNTSFVVTDPSGELVQSCGKMLERRGYKIKVFNINDMKHSSNYNPFHYLRDSTGEINSNNVIKMINVFMMNTKEEGSSGGDQFWTDATRLLLSALCFLLVETGTEEEQNFAGVLDLIHKAKVIEGKEEEKSELDVMFDERKKTDEKALSVQYYEEFKQVAGKTMQSILISTTTKLQHFKLEDVRNLTFTDNIHLETMGDEKTALFIIIPSTDTKYNFLAAMMYTQLFDVLYDRAITYYHGRLPVHVRFLLDEFANCGKIPEFEKVLATCRKFEISAVVILQNLSQLKRLYEKSWEELPGNCDTMIYLGGKDQFTNEYLSKELGKETIDQQSINQTKGKQGSSSYNNAILGRELATIDEFSTMDNR